VSVPAQRARTDAKLRTVAVSLRSSGPGLALVNVRSGRRLIAQGLAPLYGAGAGRARLRLTPAGTRLLRHPRRQRITVSALLRDVMTASARATARGTLR
jgi:hypothetical protein